jgi:long-chain acyl-CoA synthetase
MGGYFNDRQATNDAFDDDLWFKTGDLGRIEKDGYLYITGRKKNLIILNDGNNISPEELEVRISQSPIVDSVLVYAEKRNQTPVLLASIYPDFCYCVANHIADIKGEALKLICKINAENPKYMKIFDVGIRKTPFEKTATGKIIRKENAHESG